MRSLINRFSQVKVLVVGDAIEDVYHFGRVDRLSPEAPVPIFIEERQETRRGGADNVAAQLEAYGCRVKLLSGPSSIKHRYMVGGHQLLRVDRDSEGNSVTWFGINSSGFDAVVLSDYAKGFVTDAVCRNVIHHCVISGTPVIVDPKGSDWTKYRGATLICPNEKEYAEARNPDEHNLLVKLGAKGCRIDGVTIPATAKQVFDVTGAGDTLVATVAAAIGAGAMHKDAAILGNYAAGVVVGKLGTSLCTIEELRACV